VAARRVAGPENAARGALVWAAGVRPQASIR
jgi:hypothetical protein